jgi:hypothetical protein
VAQGESPKFKPQYLKKERKKGGKEGRRHQSEMVISVEENGQNIHPSDQTNVHYATINKELRLFLRQTMFYKNNNSLIPGHTDG